MNLFTLIFKEINNKNYFYSLVLLSFCLIFFVFFLIIFAHKIGYKDPEIELINYQYKKLDNKNIEVIFIGDSSLGNLIDASTWNNLSGKNTANLALTGKFQYLGNLALIKKIPNKKNVKINIISSLTNWSIGEKNLYNLIYYNKNFFIKNYYLVWFNLNRISFKRIISFYFDRTIVKSTYIENDYVEQGKILEEKNFDLTFLKSVTNQNKVKSLVKIKNYCYKNNINCEFFHGPLSKIICDNNKFPTYLKRINKNLRENGLNFNKNFICFDQDHIGDGEDHIKDNFKKKYTEEFYKLINN